MASSTGCTHAGPDNCAHPAGRRSRCGSSAEPRTRRSRPGPVHWPEAGSSRPEADMSGGCRGGVAGGAGPPVATISAPRPKNSAAQPRRTPRKGTNARRRRTPSRPGTRRSRRSARASSGRPSRPWRRTRPHQRPRSRQRRQDAGCSALPGALIDSGVFGFGGFGATLVEAERWVGVCHERGVRGHTQRPPVHALTKSWSPRG